MKSLPCVALGLAAATAAMLGETVSAQSFPQKPIRFVVPYPPSGGADFIARPIAQKLTEVWGQPVIIDNRPGANGNIGTDLVAKSPPDGYTVLFATVSPLAISPAIYKKLPFDPRKDFAPITLLASTTAVLVVHPSLPVASVGELVKFAAGRKDLLSYSSSGSGSTNHLTTESFASPVGIKLVHVPYKSGSQAIIDVVAGMIPMMFANVPVVQAHIAAGRLRGLAVTSPKRSALLPGLPTLTEAGVKDFDLSGTWYAAAAPAGTGSEVIARLHAGIVGNLKSAELSARFVKAGLDPIGNSPAEFKQYLDAQIDAWGKIARQVGASID
jgi:tripartite-type tricarboxylate transporter receptor subunit TctC